MRRMFRPVSALFAVSSRGLEVLSEGGDLKTVGEPKVFLLIAFDHQLVYQDNVRVRHELNRLDAQTQHRFPTVIHVYAAAILRDTVYPSRHVRTWNFEVAATPKLRVLLRTQHLGKHLLGARFRGQPLRMCLVGPDVMPV